MRLKRAREYRLYSRTIMPIAALYVAGFAVGRVVYFATDHLGLFWGPLGELRRPLPRPTSGRPFPAGGWMDWVPVLLAGVFLLAEVRRQQGRRVPSRERLLVAGYAVAVLGGAGAAVGGRLPELVLVAAAVLAAGLFVCARWSRWTRATRAIAVGASLAAATIAMALLRLEDIVRRGYPGG